MTDNIIIRKLQVAGDVKKKSWEMEISVKASVIGDDGIPILSERVRLAKKLLAMSRSQIQERFDSGEMKIQ